MSKKEVKYSAAEKNNDKLLEIQKTVSSIKEGTPCFAEFLKAMGKFTDHTKGWMDSGDATRTALTKIAGVKKYDNISKAVRGVDNCLMELFKQRLQVSDSYVDNVVKKWGDEFHKDKSLAEFEKSFKAKRANSLKLIKKAEANHAKTSKPRAMKKAPEKADEAKKELDDAVNAHEDMLSQELHVVVLMERKRYAVFLHQLGQALEDEAKAMKACISALEQCQEDIVPGLKADSEENFPDDIKKLIGQQELLKSGSLHAISSASGNAIKKGDEEDSSEESSDKESKEKGKEKRGGQEKDADSETEEATSSEEEAPSPVSPPRKATLTNGAQPAPSPVSPPRKATLTNGPQVAPSPPPPSAQMNLPNAFNGAEVFRGSPRVERREPSNPQEEDQHLKTLDSPPPLPVRAGEDDMEDELSRILSSFDSVKLDAGVVARHYGQN